MPKANSTLEIYDANLWQAYDEYIDVRRIASHSIGKAPYYLDEQNRHDEMLASFVSIHNTEDLNVWIQEYGLPENLSNWSVSYLLERVNVMRWLLSLVKAANIDQAEFDSYLAQQFVANPSNEHYEWLALSEFQSSQLSILDSKIHAYERDPRDNPPLNKAEEKSRGIILAQLEKFRHSYVLVEFVNDSMAALRLPIAIAKRGWTNSPDQLRLLARIAVAQKAGEQMAYGLGAKITVELKLDPKGPAVLHPTFSVRNPWQAMNYALYKHAIQNHGVSFCRFCAKAFTPKRKSGAYCPPPAKCKDSYNNSKR